MVEEVPWLAAMSYAQDPTEDTKEIADEKVKKPESPDVEMILEDNVIVAAEGEDPESPEPKLTLKEDVAAMVVDLRSFGLLPCLMLRAIFDSTVRHVSIRIVSLLITSFRIAINT